MRTLQEKYNAIQEGKFSKDQFLVEARMQHPNLVTRFNGYDDAVQILKNRGMISEVKLEEARLTKNSLTDYRYKPTNDMDKYPYEQILRGLRVELEVMEVYGTPTADEYKKALGKVLKNLEKDEIFYTNQLAGNNKKVDLHDKMVDATAKNTVDTFNGMKKIKDLKENISSLKNLPDGKYFAIDGDWDEEYKGHNGLFFTLKGLDLIGSDGQNFQTSPEEFLSQFTPDEIVRVEESSIKEDHSKNPDDKYVVRPCKSKGEPWAVWEGEKRVKGFATKEEAKEYADKQNKKQGLTESVLKEGIKNLIKKALMENEEDVYEMQGPKSDAEYKRELENYLEDNQIYGYTDMLFDILTAPDEEQVADNLADFLDDHQIYGYNKGLLAIFRDYANRDQSEDEWDEADYERMSNSIEDKKSPEIPGFEGTRDELDDLFESKSLKDLL